jgi:4-hydroxybenzoate polyprenyltransferase
MVTVPWTAAMAVFASSMFGDFGSDMWASGDFYITLVMVMMASWLGVTAGYALNDYFDYRVDLANPERMDKAANLGARRGSMIQYAAVLGVPSLLIWAYLSHYALVMAIVQLLFILVYSGWAKPRTPYSNMFVVIPTALMPVTVFLVYTPELVREAVLLAAVNGAFEPGFTWSGVCRDVGSDRRLGIPSLPIVKGIPAVANMVLTVWIGVIVLTGVTWYYTDLGVIFLVGAMFAALWLVAAGIGFVRDPTEGTGGATFLRSTLWFWVFSIALIVDTAFNVQLF